MPHSNDIAPQKDAAVGRIQGWIVSREKKDKNSILLNVLKGDTASIITLIVNKEEHPYIYSLLERVRRGAAIDVVVHEEEKTGGYRIASITMINEPENPPSNNIYLRSNRHVIFEYYANSINDRALLMRNPVIRAIFKIKGEILFAARKILRNWGFLEMNFPKIVNVNAESDEVFQISYFDGVAFLAQSPQLYKQMMMISVVPGVFEIAPCFRAKKCITKRHLCEYWEIDVEKNFIYNLDDILNLIETFIIKVLSYVKRSCREELDIIGVDVKIPNRPLKRITYAKVIDSLSDEGIDIPYGSDLRPEHEELLGEIMYEKGYEMFFITHFPTNLKPFYIMRDDDQTTRSFDLEYRGLEIASGGQREHRYEVLAKNLISSGRRLETFKPYLEIFRYGIPPHGGFGLGIERLLMQMLKLGDIRNAVIFPRDFHTITP